MAQNLSKLMSVFTLLLLLYKMFMLSMLSVLHHCCYSQKHKCASLPKLADILGYLASNKSSDYTQYSKVALLNTDVYLYEHLIDWRGHCSDWRVHCSDCPAYRLPRSLKWCFTLQNLYDRRLDALLSMNVAIPIHPQKYYSLQNVLIHNVGLLFNNLICVD